MPLAFQGTAFLSMAVALPGPPQFLHAFSLYCCSSNHSRSQRSPEISTQKISHKGPSGLWRRDQLASSFCTCSQLHLYLHLHRLLYNPSASIRLHPIICTIYPHHSSAPAPSICIHLLAPAPSICIIICTICAHSSAPAPAQCICIHPSAPAPEPSICIIASVPPSFLSSSHSPPAGAGEDVLADAQQRPQASFCELAYLLLACVRTCLQVYSTAPPGSVSSQRLQLLLRDPQGRGGQVPVRVALCCSMVWVCMLNRVMMGRCGKFKHALSVVEMVWVCMLNHVMGVHGMVWVCILNRVMMGRCGKSKHALLVVGMVWVCMLNHVMGVHGMVWVCMLDCVMMGRCGKSKHALLVVGMVWQIQTCAVSRWDGLGVHAQPWDECAWDGLGVHAQLCDDGKVWQIQTCAALQSWWTKHMLRLHKQVQIVRRLCNHGELSMLRLHQQRLCTS
eukprot:1158402-Pelagomonas_calceolata.AAC.25